jgi:hypothetical protein
MKRRAFINHSLKGAALMALPGTQLACRSGTKEDSTAFIDRLLPAPKNGGFRDDRYWIWGSSVIKGEDGKYHMFASRWSKDVGFGNWVSNSEVVRAVSDTPLGPYSFQEVVLPARGPEFFDGMCTHNPRIVRYRDKYLLYHFGTTYDFPMPDKAYPDVSEDNWALAWMNKRIGLAISDSVYGPWERGDKPVIEPRPGHWDASITSNPAPAVDEKTGNILLMYKSSADGLIPPLLLGVSMAGSPRGEYLRLSEEPVFRFETSDNNYIDVEDPYIWWTGKRYEAIIKDRSGEICGEEGGGVHAWSPDGIQWMLFDKVKAYSRNILWEDGTRTVQNHFERPFLLIEDGQPTHLFAAVGEGPKAWNFENTWNMVIPLLPQYH